MQCTITFSERPRQELHDLAHRPAVAQSTTMRWEKMSVRPEGAIHQEGLTQIIVSAAANEAFEQKSDY